MKALTDAEKLDAYTAGHYVCPVPPVCTTRWDAKAWIRWIDGFGRWTDGPSRKAGANARLIAAAPDLLEALRAMLDPSHECGRDCVMSEPCPIGDQARAAIRKAERD